MVAFLRTFCKQAASVDSVFVKKWSVNLNVFMIEIEIDRFISNYLRTDNTCML